MIRVWAIILFGLLIFFHELGHFIFAKLMGVKVLKFSLGFPPAILRKKIGDTEYVISAVPLGGYVKMLGEEPGEELAEEDKARSFKFQSAWKRALIVLAGPVFNLVLAYLIFTAFLSFDLPISIPDLNREMHTTIVVIKDDSPAQNAALRENDTIVSIDGREVSSWAEIQQAVFDHPGKTIVLGVERGADVLEIAVVPEARTVKDRKGKEITYGDLGITKKTAVVGGVVKDSPASRSGLRSGDVIVSIDGVTVNTWVEMTDIIMRSPGEEIVLQVKRPSGLSDIPIVPEPAKIQLGSDEEKIIGRIGITLQGMILSRGVLYAPIDGFRAVYEWSALTIEALVKILTGSISAKQVGGPILIVGAAAKAASAGAFTYFNFIAIISINLAIINLVPIPILDGGHLMFLSIEGLRRRPLSEAFMMAATKVGLAMIILLVILVFYNDIVRIIVPWVQKTFGV